MRRHPRVPDRAASTGACFDLVGMPPTGAEPARAKWTPDDPRPVRCD